MSWIESRLQALEDRFRVLYRWLLDLQQQLRAVQQGLISAAQQSGAQPSTSGGGGYYVAYPTAAVNGATWASGAPTTIVTYSATVWQVSYDGTSQAITSLGTKTCTNALPSGLAANHPCIVTPDGSGSYGTLCQSCTSA